jgi:hypothetical protein
MHDGAPAHFSRAVRDVLNNTYVDKWTGRAGTTARPPRSSHLNPLHFYLWEHLEPLVYAAPADTEEEALHHRTVDASQAIRNCPGIFERMRRSMRRVKRALNPMKDILSTYYKCSVSAINHKLNIYEHML